MNTYRNLDNLATRPDIALMNTHRMPPSAQCRRALHRWRPRHHGLLTIYVRECCAVPLQRERAQFDAASLLVCHEGGVETSKGGWDKPVREALLADAPAPLPKSEGAPERFDSDIGNGATVPVTVPPLDHASDTILNSKPKL